jgi:pimeloyl-ACP methyl ester carboxylesterase
LAGGARSAVTQLNSLLLAPPLGSMPSTAAAGSLGGMQDAPSTEAPPSSRVLLCLHGAGSSPSVFDAWAGSFPGWEVVAPDLQAGLELSTASMEDYVAAAIRAAARPIPSSTVALCGWSMGGLVALIATERLRPASLVVLEPSLPAEIAGVHPEFALLSGTFDPAEVYGSWPGDPPARLESSLALAERRRGISVPSVSCPLLVVASGTYPDSRGSSVASLYGGELISFSDLHHVSLVEDGRVRAAIFDWLSRALGG